MTVYDPSYPLSGGRYGGHWEAAAQAQSSAAHAAYLAYQRTCQALADEARKRANRALEDAGIRAGEIVAWRAWRITDDGLRLTSVAMACVWPVGVPMTGSPKHGVGVHAFKELDDAIEQYPGYIGPMCYGKVALWGEVIEHERGYRAEFGKVHSLHKIDGGKRPWFRKDRRLERLCKEYGVPLGDVKQVA